MSLGWFCLSSNWWNQLDFWRLASTFLMLESIFEITGNLNALNIFPNYQELILGVKNFWFHEVDSRILMTDRIGLRGSIRPPFNLKWCLSNFLWNKGTSIFLAKLIYILYTFTCKISGQYVEIYQSYDYFSEVGQKIHFNKNGQSMKAGKKLGLLKLS